MHRINNFFNDNIVSLCGAILLLFVGFYNGAPMVTSDSGAYMTSGNHLVVPNDRPIFYGLFLIASNFRITMWTSLFLQTFVLSHLIHELLHIFFKDLNNISKLLIYALILFFTSVAWYTVQVMPDIFTPILGLSIIVYLFSESDKSKIQKKIFNKENVLLTIIFISLLMHLSHLFIVLGTIFIYLILSFIFKTLARKRIRMYKVFLLLPIAVLIICFSNVAGKKGFVLSKASHVFLIGKLCENGMLKTILNDKCATKNYKLCAFKNKIPKHSWEFVWSADGAFAKSGGWDSSKMEYSEIINTSFSESKYQKLHAQEAAKATFQQVQLSDVGDGLNSFYDSKYITDIVKGDYFLGGKAFMSSKQNLVGFPLEKINMLIKNYLILTACLSFILLLFIRDEKVRLLFVLMIIFVIMNAGVTGAVANVLSRLNSRALWLLPFMSTALIMNFLNQLYNNKFKKASANKINV
jgi:hypothetical protein